MFVTMFVTIATMSVFIIIDIKKDMKLSSVEFVDPIKKAFRGIMCRNY